MGEWWEHRPHGQPAWTQAHFLWFHLPPALAGDSLLAQRDQWRQKDAAALALLSQQNAAVQALGLQSRDLQAQAETAVARGRAAQGAASSLDRQIATIIRTSTAQSSCPALDPADKAFVAYLKGAQ